MVVWFSCIGSFVDLVASGLLGLSLWVTCCYSSVSGKQNILFSHGALFYGSSLLIVPWL